MSTDSTFLDVSDLIKTPFSDPIPSDQVNLIISSAPFLSIPSALNTRTISSASLKANYIYRSGTLSHLPASSLAILKSKYNITTIFDLRSLAERKKTPSPVFEGVETIWVPSTKDVDPTLLGAETQVDDEGVGEVKKRDDRVFKPEEFVTNEGQDGVIKLYGNILESHREAYKGVFNRLKAGTEGAVLFHCTAGKDRTGVLAAMMLALVDAPPEDIEFDYALTRIGVEPFREYLVGALLQQMGRENDKSALEEPGMEAMCGVRGPSILAVLEWMGEKWKLESANSKIRYPGVEGYLSKELGFSSDEIVEIKKALSA